MNNSTIASRLPAAMVAHRVPVSSKSEEELVQPEEQAPLDPELRMDFGHMARYIGIPVSLLSSAILDGTVNVPLENEGTRGYIRAKYVDTLRAQFANAQLTLNPQSAVSATEDEPDFAHLPATLSMYQMLEIFPYSSQTMVNWVNSGKIEGSKTQKGMWGFDKASAERQYRKLQAERLAATRPPVEQEAREEETVVQITQETSQAVETWTDEEAALYLDRSIATIVSQRNNNRITGSKDANEQESVKQYKRETQQGIDTPSAKFVAYQQRATQQEEEQLTPSDGRGVEVEMTVDETAGPGEALTTTTTPTPELHDYTPHVLVPVEPVEQQQQQHTPPMGAYREFQLFHDAGQVALESLTQQQQSQATPVSMRNITPQLRAFRCEFLVDGEPIEITVLYDGRSFFPITLY